MEGSFEVRTRLSPRAGDRTRLDDRSDPRQRELLSRRSRREEVVDLAVGVLDGSPVARADLRRALVAALPAPAEQVAAGVLSLVPVGAVVSTGPVEVPDEAVALVAAAVQVAETPAEACSFLALAMGAVHDAVADRSVGQGTGAAGGRAAPFRPADGPLRLPPGVPHLDVVPPDRVQWPFEDERVFPVVAFEGWECLALVATATSAISSAHPPYRIDHLVPDDACAGEGIEIIGEGFGTDPGRVQLPSPRGGFVSVRAADWSPTHIRLVLPQDVASGPVGLAIELPAQTVCGKRVPVFRRGTDATLLGGAPLIRSFMVEVGPEGHVDSSRPVSVSWDVAPDLAGVVHLQLDGPGGERLTFPDLPGGRSRVAIDLGSFTRAGELSAALTVTNRCATTRAETRVPMSCDPGLTLSDIELTQAIQGPSPTSLVADRPTAVRVYASVRADFDWGLGVGRVPVVARLVHGARTQTQHTVVTSVTDHDDPRSSVTFVLPAHDVSGHVGVYAELTTDPGAAPVPRRQVASTTALAVDRPRDGRRVVLVRVGHPERGHARPGREEFLDDWSGAWSRLPLGVDQWTLARTSPEVDIPDGTDLLTPAPTGSTELDRAARDRVWLTWSALLSGVYRAAAGIDGVAMIIGILPDDPAYLLAGIGAVPTALYRAGLEETLAHEIGHAIGQGHTLFPTAPPDKVPERPDLVTPTHTSQTGWNLVTGTPVATNAADLMSYDPAPRWPVQERWDRLKAVI